MWRRLDRFFTNAETKMTAERYLSMCEQMGTEPIEDEVPPEYADFPEIAQIAINIFNQLGDRVYPEIGYMGKDYVSLPLYIENYGIKDTELLLEVLSWLDSRAIKKSSEHMKKEYDKLKRKSSGPK